MSFIYNLSILVYNEDNNVYQLQNVHLCVLKILTALIPLGSDGLRLFANCCITA